MRLRGVSSSRVGRTVHDRTAVLVVVLLVAFGAVALAQPTVFGTEPARITPLESRQWVTLVGAGFDAGDVVTFWWGDRAFEIPRERTQYVDATRVRVLVGLFPGDDSWTVRVTNAAGVSSTAVRLVFETTSERGTDPVARAPAAVESSSVAPERPASDDAAVRLARAAELAQRLGEPLEELRKLTSDGGRFAEDRWQTGVGTLDTDAEWTAAWFESPTERRIYLLDVRANWVCRWVGLPQSPSSSSEWMLVTRLNSSSRFVAGLVVRVWVGGSSLMGRYPTYAMLPNGSCWQENARFH